jgi:hypothetical protein
LPVGLHKLIILQQCTEALGNVKFVFNDSPFMAIITIIAGDHAIFSGPKDFLGDLLSHNQAYTSQGFSS